MTYGRIEREDQLPPAGPVDHRSREKLDIDFKRFADKAKISEHAKDLAAFANSVGGTLLVGADNESNPTLLNYPGIRGQTAAEVRSIYEQAGMLCSPTLIVDTIPISAGGVQLVAVNVDPFIDQLVGAPAPNDGWRFPVRRASQTDFVTPENIPMYIHRQARRSYLLLTSIPVTERRDVTIYFPRVANGMTGALDTSHQLLTLESVPQDRNHIVLRDGTRQVRVPLADIVDVWAPADGSWAIKVSGFINHGGTRNGQEQPITYSPRF